MSSIITNEDLYPVSEQIGEKIMTTVLPKSDVTASASKEGTTVVVRASASRDGKSRAWQGSGKDAGEAVKGLVENILNDPITGEFMP